MCAATRRSYRDVNHWRAYQAALPARIRLSPNAEPAEEWRLWQGAEIHLDRFAAPTAPATVMILHGGGGYGRLLAPFGRMLHARGYEVVLPDLPGYGLTIAGPEHFSYAKWVDCVVDLVAAEKRRRDRPVVVLGMSVGGYLGYLAAAKGGRIDGVIATTLADPRLPIVRDQFARCPGLNRLVSPLLPAAKALCGGLRLPIKWFANMQTIVNNPTLAQQLSDDPLGGGNCVPLGFMHSLLTVEPALAPEQFDVCPVLLAQPADDRWTTLAASTPVFDRIKGKKQLVMLPNCGHIPIEEPGLGVLEDACVSLLESVSGAPAVPSYAA